MLIIDFNQILDTWRKALDEYSFTQLLVKPSPTGWSIGQVYMHLISATQYFIKQMQICASGNDHAEEEISATAKNLFLNNDLPDTLLEGPPSNANTPQPESKEQLIEGLRQLKNEMNETEMLISKSQYRGKTKHFGLGYFNANEWMQFAEIHFRHHLRQKKRMDDYIKG